jgi:hypothetical protein
MQTKSCGKVVNNSVEKSLQKMFIRNVQKLVLVEKVNNIFAFSHSIHCFKQVLKSFSHPFSTMFSSIFNLLKESFTRFPQISTNTITIIYIEKGKELL